MVDTPRALWGIRRDDGGVLAPAGLVVLFMLWGHITVRRKLAGGPHFVFHTVERLADLRGVDKRTIESGLKALRTVTGRPATAPGGRRALVEAGTFERERGFWLFTPPGYEDPPVVVDGRIVAPAQPPDALDTGGERRSGDGDRRSILRRSPIEVAGRSPIEVEEIADPEWGRSPIEVAEIADRSWSRKEGASVKPIKPLSARSTTVMLAEEIARGAPTPDGCDPLSVSATGLRWLVELLDSGEDPQLVRDVLARAPELVALPPGTRHRQEARWYGPAMFDGERWLRWVAAYRALQRAEDQAATAAAAEAAARARAEAAALEQRRREQAEQVHGFAAWVHELVARPRAPRGAEAVALAGPPSRATNLLRAAFAAPVDALAAVQRAIEAARAAEREPSLHELEDAVLQLPQAKCPAPGDELGRIRAARETAEREGRVWSLDEFNEAAKVGS
jgi:hypothetical protein